MAANGEHGVGKYRIGEHVIGEHGIGEYGIGEHGIGEHGIGEYGIGEHGIGKMLRHPHKDTTSQAALHTQCQNVCCPNYRKQLIVT